MIKTLRQKALDLLSRREHSRFELAHKLKRYEVPEYEIEALLTILENQNLLSDARFAEAYLQSRFNKGYGPVRITQELQARAVSEEIISQVLESISLLRWQTLAKQVRQKKFGQTLPSNFQDNLKQNQFLLYRGFRSDELKAVFLIRDSE